MSDSEQVSVLLYKQRAKSAIVHQKCLFPQFSGKRSDARDAALECACSRAAVVQAGHVIHFKSPDLKLFHATMAFLFGFLFT